MASPSPVPGVSQEAAPPARREPANLGDILERVLERGIVIAGDIQVNLLDIELLTLKLRLVIASVDTAREMGIDWWETDPWLTGRGRAQVRGGRAAPLTTGDRDARGLTANAELRDG